MPSDGNSLSDLTRIVYTYGPSAIFVLYFYFSNKEIKRYITTGDVKNNLFWRSMFLINVVITVVFAGIVCYFYYIVNHSDVAVKLNNYTSMLAECKGRIIFGKISNLALEDDVRNNTECLYLNHHYYKDSKLKAVDWIFLRSSPQLTEGHVKFLVHNDSTNDRLSFKIPLNCLDVDHLNAMTMNKNKVSPLIVLDRSLCSQKKFQEEQSMANNDDAPASVGKDNESSWFFKNFIGRAYAQSVSGGVSISCAQFDESNVVSSLNSSNPKDNTDAVSLLIKCTERSLPLIQRVINDKGSTSQQKLGAVNALRRMPPPLVKGLSRETINEMLKFVAGDDYGLRINSLRFFTNNYKSTEYDYKKILSDALSASIVSGKDQNTTFYLAIANLEYLYTLGIKTAYDYTEDNFTDSRLIEGAISCLDSAWALHSLVSDKYKIYFVKALYGKANAMHDRYVVIKRGGKYLDAGLQREAIEAFQYFLDQYNSCVDKESYPYDESVSRARRYIANPVASSLQ
jgi:hypothetical protein